MYDFDPSKKEDPEFKPLFLTVTRISEFESNKIKESYSPLLCMNINVTKELGDFMRASFYANNMFRNYPTTEYDRFPGSYTARRIARFFFGFELAVTIR